MRRLEVGLRKRWCCIDEVVRGKPDKMRLRVGGALRKLSGEGQPCIDKKVGGERRRKR